MNPRLPALRPRKVLKALKKAGFYEDHRTGSHIILYKDSHPNPVIVPRHNKAMKRGTLFRIIRDAGLSLEEFMELL